MENERNINQLEGQLFKLSRLKKEGKNVEPLIRKTEVVLFEAVDKELDNHHHFKRWERQIGKK